MPRPIEYFDHQATAEHVEETSGVTGDSLRKQPLGMEIPRLYSEIDGQSHWGSLTIDLAPGDGDWVSSLCSAAGVSFRRAPSDLILDWHPAPRRQLVVTLTGEVEYEIGDGTRRRFGPGSIILAEDVTGQGHIARGVGSQDRTSLYIPLDVDDGRIRPMNRLA